ncbi:MAG TPA: nitroreductase family protein [Candidatus Acidoferrum sp.]|nr:nitroreductase family protein [Candidatus Acidoferrum sp.]
MKKKSRASHGYMTMNVDEAIKGRRSIRSYTDKSVPMELVREVLEAGIFAPSAKNGQQWRFTVLEGEAKKELTTLFHSELQKLSGKIGMKNMGSSFASCRVMEEAPILVMVWNENQLKMLKESSLQSVAAAIQNMLLKAYSLGLGSLWICDIYYATKALTKHLRKPWTLVATVTLGWPAEAPAPRPRKAIDEVAEFLL